jgi:hypothetical protein
MAVVSCNLNLARKRWWFIISLQFLCGALFYRQNWESLSDFERIIYQDIHYKWFDLIKNSSFFNWFKYPNGRVWNLCECFVDDRKWKKLYTKPILLKLVLDWSHRWKCQKRSKNWK